MVQGTKLLPGTVSFSGGRTDISRSALGTLPLKLRAAGRSGEAGCWPGGHKPP